MANADSTPGKSPAFQFYPKDFITDSNVIVMTMAERGAYITLICLCWLEGSLPSDLARLSRLCGSTPVVFGKMWPAIEPCFRPAKRGSDRLIHPRLERERQKQAEFREEQSRKGKASAAARNRKATESNRGSTAVQPSAVQPKPNSSSSISDLQSSDSSQRTNVREFPATKEPTTTEERAGHFVTVTYPALYQKYRKGARYVSKPALDFQEAVELCRVWDDERLAKIASVFLTTDHKFAESGSRTMAQFRSLASWCDSELVVYEAEHGPIQVGIA